MTKPAEIDPNCTDIPAGWPRPYYIEHDLHTEVKVRKYTQWSSGRAHEQIMLCDADRLYTAGKNFACSSCAQVMQEGVILDLEWLRQQGMKVDDYDGHYGSPICYRCLAFAMKQCPYFAKYEAEHGDDLQWIRVLSKSDYEQLDETGCIVVTKGGLRRKRITLGQIKARVYSKEYALTDDNVGTRIEKCPQHLL